MPPFAEHNIGFGERPTPRPVVLRLGGSLASICGHLFWGSWEPGPGGARTCTHPVLPLLFLGVTLYVAAHARVAGGAVDAGDAVGGVLPADAEVCSLAAAISWRAKQGMWALEPRNAIFCPQGWPPLTPGHVY